MDNSEVLELFSLSERLFNQLLDRIQTELDSKKLYDINNVRALIILNIGEAEMTISDLLWRGCYMGSNVSYNLKKLTEAGYVVQARSSHDRRVVRVRNSPKGIALFRILETMNTQHVEALAAGGLTPVQLRNCSQTLRALNRVWSQRQSNRPVYAASEGHAATT